MTEMMKIVESSASEMHPPAVVENNFVLGNRGGKPWRQVWKGQLDLQLAGSSPYLTNTDYVLLML